MGLHPAQAAHALRALLRRRGVGAALLRQRAGWKSGERRGPPAGRQHRQRHGVGDLPRVPRLLPPHRRPGPGQAWRRDLPRQDPGVRGPALQDVQHPHSPARRKEKRKIKGVPKAVTTGILSIGRCWRKAASAGRPSRCAAARARLPWRPSRRSRSRPSTTRSTASTLTTCGRWNTGATWSSADAGRLRSARLRALQPCDGVSRGAPASGARSDTAAAAEPLLGVDCRNRKKKIPSSCFLAFSIMLIFDPPQLLKEITFSAAFRCVQVGGQERPLKKVYRVVSAKRGGGWPERWCTGISEKSPKLSFQTEGVGGAVPPEEGFHLPFNALRASTSLQRALRLL